MQSKKYKFFDTVIEVLTPDIIEDIDPYTSFLCNENPNYVVTFEYVNQLPAISENASIGNEVAFLEEHDKRICWYKSHGSDKYFAYRISKDNTSCIKITDEFKGKLWSGVIFNLMGFEEIMAMENCVVLHGSMVRKNGKMVIFTAPCGTGKSTQASLWEKYAGAEIVNGDKCLVKNENGNIMAGGLVFSGSSTICKNLSAPLCAVVGLGQAKENILRKMTEGEAFITLLQGNYRFAMGEKASNKSTDVIEQICNCIPVYKLDCLPDKSAVECLEKELGL